MNKDGLVVLIGGGGVKNIVTLGSIDVWLSEQDRSIVDRWYGVSSGSLMAFLLSCGCSPSECVERVCASGLLGLLDNVSITNVLETRALASYESTRACIVRAHSSASQTLDQHPTFAAFATKVDTRTSALSVYLLHASTTPQLTVADAILLSSRIPFVIEAPPPLPTGCKLWEILLDGGIANNAPISVIRSIVGARARIVAFIPRAIVPIDDAVGPSIVTTLLGLPVDAHADDECARAMNDHEHDTCVVRVHAPNDFIPYGHSRTRAMTYFLWGRSCARAMRYRVESSRT